MIIAVHNFKGGIGTTMIAAHMCILAREKGLRVAGMSAEFKKELPLFLAPVGIRCVDPGRDEGGDYDLIVVDLHSHKEVCPVPVDAWILPIANRTSLERACELSDRRMGSLVWIGNRRRVTDKDVPRYLRGVVHVAPPIPNSRAIAIAGDELRHVWHDDELAQSPGGRALRASLNEILAHLGVTEAAAAARAKDDEILSALDRALTKLRVKTTTESATPAEEVPEVPPPIH